MAKAFYVQSVNSWYVKYPHAHGAPTWERCHNRATANLLARQWNNTNAQGA